MRWIKSGFLLLIFYGTFLVAAGCYTRNAIRYAGVENWPSVPATIVGQTGELASYPSGGKYGSGHYTLDTRSVLFDYAVAGRTYRGTEFSPDGGGLNPPSADYQGRAFYDPSAPEIAVLVPVPFKGAGWLTLAGVIGFMMLVQLWCAALGFREKRIWKKARHRSRTENEVDPPPGRA